MEFKQFFDACPLGIFVIDSQGYPYYINPKAITLLGKGVLNTVTVDQLNTVYQSYQAGTNQLYPTTEHPLIKALQGESVIIEDMEIHQGGQIIPVEFSAAPVLNEQGKLIFAIAIFQDIRERQDRQKAQELLHQQLVRQNQGLRQENQSLKAQIAKSKTEFEDSLKNGAITFLKRLLLKRFGAISKAVESRLHEASIADLERWGDRLLEVNSLSEVFD